MPMLMPMNNDGIVCAMGGLIHIYLLKFAKAAKRSQFPASSKSGPNQCNSFNISYSVHLLVQYLIIVNCSVRLMWSNGVEFE